MKDKTTQLYNSGNIAIEVLRAKLTNSDIKFPITKKESEKRKKLYLSLLEKKVMSGKTCEDLINETERITLDDETMKLFKECCSNIKEGLEETKTALQECMEYEDARTFGIIRDLSESKDETHG